MRDDFANTDLATRTAASNDRVQEIVARAQRQRGGYGCFVLFRRELDRFTRYAGQTIISPALTTLLWFVVFGFSLGERVQEVRGIPYVDFLVPGLVMMSLILNTFLNAGFSFFISKIHGTVIDLLVAPLTPIQIIIGYAGASVLRGLAVGVVIWGVAIAMGASTLFNIGITVVFMILTCLSFSLFGLITGILAQEFDHINFIPNFLIIPLTFLGGVFYSIEMLPAPWGTISLCNPVLYMVNGLRYGMTGVSDVPASLGFGIVCLACLICLAIAWWLLATGRKLRE